MLSQPDVFIIDTTVRTVSIKVGEKFEDRDLRYLSSQMKQGLVTQIQQAIWALAVLKKTGHKVGCLKFKTFLYCIPLKQYDVTYQLDRTRHQVKLQKQFVNLSNQRKEIRNQLVAYLVRRYETKCFQDELLRAWQRVYGKKMADLSLGAFLRILAERSRTPVEVPSTFPSTQRCSDCGHKLPVQLPLSQRVYRCYNPKCALVLDRDLNAEFNLWLEGLGLDSRYYPSRCSERNTVMPVETKTATQRMVDHFNVLPFVRASLVRESGSSDL